MSTQQNQPTAGAMRAAKALLNVHAFPAEQAYAAQIIDRETQADVTALREALTRASALIGELRTYTPEEITAETEDEHAEIMAILARHAGAGKPGKAKS